MCKSNLHAVSTNIEYSSIRASIRGGFLPLYRSLYDGNRVAQTINGVTKYYFAGSQRVAMRTNGTLYYLLSDHLGSTSITTDTNGTLVSEQRYKAWGEVRYTSGTQQTQYQYTGQYSNMGDFGLMFYNARWYDPCIMQFNQPDSVIPDPYNTLDWNR